jgi:hypothetical protein
MKLANALPKKCVVLGCLCAGALAVVACADGPGGPTGPSAGAAVSGLAATVSSRLASQSTPDSVKVSFPRSGELRITKDCANDGTNPYSGHAGDFCTIISSNVEAIEVGSKVVYALAATADGVLDSPVTLVPPRPGNSIAFGHCQVSLVNGTGLCTFSGGTGKFTTFDAHAEVSPSPLGGLKFVWNGTYSFDPRY